MNDESGNKTYFSQRTTVCSALEALARMRCIMLWYGVEVFTYLLFMPVGGAVVAIVNGCKISLKCVLVACNYACVPLLP